jgi:hypothetical protein
MQSLIILAVLMLIGAPAVILLMAKLIMPKPSDRNSGIIGYPLDTPPPPQRRGGPDSGPA